MARKARDLSCATADASPRIRSPHSRSPNGDAARAKRGCRFLTSNLPTGRSTTVACTQNAWNRLVGVEYGQTVRGSYVYNSLNWRILKQADTDGTGGPDQQRLMHYSAAPGMWQPLQEDVRDAWTEQTPGDIDRHVQYVWGSRYIDDIVLRREDRVDNQEDPGPDGDYGDAGDITRYYLTDAQFTPVAIIDDGADVIERISYMPYGHARHHRMADLDGDGDTDSYTEPANPPSDYLILQANWGEFGIGDLTRDGTVNTSDTLDLIGDAGSAIPAGQISYDSEDNQIGYCGYVFNKETQDYTVRNRHYSPDLGRWLERDPAGYVDGMALYHYVRSSPLAAADSSGLKIDKFIGCTTKNRTDANAADTAVTNRVTSLLQTLSASGKFDPIEVELEMMAQGRHWGYNIVRVKYQIFWRQVRHVLRDIQSQLRDGYDVDCCMTDCQPGEIAYVLGWDWFGIPVVRWDKIYVCEPWANGNRLFQAEIFLHELSHMEAHTKDYRGSYQMGLPINPARPVENYNVKQMASDAYFYQDLQNNDPWVVFDTGAPASMGPISGLFRYLYPKR
ncbi:MAG: RHS repeat-associated core domain-containing protein [Planctomycetota bacterium]|nr:RHS repeat-associated core domain-containing protein [Planctomycetota bacterium]